MNRSTASLFETLESIISAKQMEGIHWNKCASLEDRETYSQCEQLNKTCSIICTHSLKGLSYVKRGANNARRNILKIVIC